MKSIYQKYQNEFILIGEQKIRQTVKLPYFVFTTEQKIIIQIWQMSRMIFCITDQISIITFNRKKLVKFKRMTLIDVEIKT